MEDQERLERLRLHSEARLERLRLRTETDREQLKMLRRGVEIWNQWRDEHPDAELKLNSIDLAETHLSRVNLSRANLNHTLFWMSDLRGANLSSAHLRSVNLDYAFLNGANLDHIDLSEAHLVNTDLIKANLTHARLERTDLREANFSEANLTNANLDGANLRGANFIHANLSGASLRDADLSGSRMDSSEHLDGTDLRGANLQGADLKGADLRGANLQGADLKGADLRGANLQGTNLKGANLSEADLSEADLDHTSLSDADLSCATSYWTRFCNLDLRSVKGLDTIKHDGPSTIGIDTIYRSQGNIPEIFLRGAGVPDTMIEYMRSLLEIPIDYYTCFISYSSRDEAFAKRLYADLQSKGVRCWFAPEDLRIGAKIRSTVDESIRLYDKLLIVLSRHSVASQWVEQEVETALERERKEQRNVLFPIRLDKAVMEMEGGWLALIRNTRNIGNFTRWKSHDAYQEALDRLLRDLKAEW